MFLGVFWAARGWCCWLLVVSECYLKNFKLANKSNQYILRFCHYRWDSNRLYGT